MQAQAAERERQPVSGAAVTDPSPPLSAHVAALAPHHTAPLRIPALDGMWGPDAVATVARTSYLARVDALEALVAGGEKSQGALPARRVAGLEQLSGV
jgi:hypothetical protein